MPTIEADLSIELALPDRDPVRGRLSGTGSRLVLDLDDPGVFAGRADADAVAAAAEQLAALGVVVRVTSREQHLITLGAVRAPWWQRRLTGSRRIMLGSLRGLWTSARSRARNPPPALPGLGLVPPGTLWPPAPTFQRRARRVPRTTHDEHRGGEPRLVLVKEAVWEGERQPIFWLSDGAVIGSADGVAIELPGLAARHAVVRHTDDDEWEVEPLDGTVRIHSAAGRQVLRTGTHIEVGEHVLVYSRAEFADHGRPHGGRIGGELGRQLPQDERRARSDERPREV